MKLPDHLPDTPYRGVAFRLNHFHSPDDAPEEEYPGTLLLEIAGKLAGTEAEVVVPFELTADMALELVDELIAQYRCLVQGPPEDEADELEEEEE